MGYTNENVNALGINQLSGILNSIIAQATGVTGLAINDESSFVSVAQKALLQGYDPMTQAISQVLSSTIFSVRPYDQKFKAINVDNIRYGNHVRKLQTLDKEFEDDDRLTLEDGDSIDMFKVNKPEVVQTNWYGSNQYQKSLTIYRDQLDTAFSSSSEFGRFITMIMQNASDMITQAKENEARFTLNNMIGAVLEGKNPNQVVNVLAEYNEFAGTNISKADIFNPENFPNFVRWLYSYINVRSDYLTERTALYHKPIGEDIIMRHTPKSEQRLFLYQPIVRMMETLVSSVTYHVDKMVFPPYEGVNYWQAITEPTHIKVVPAMTDDSGDYVRGSEIESEVLGVLFDREALGMTTVNEWAAATPFNARGGYYNHYWHFTQRFWNDFSENCLVFIMEDPE